MPGSADLGNAFANDGTKPMLLIISASACAAASGSARAAGVARTRPASWAPAMATSSFGDLLVEFMSGLLFRGFDPRA